MGTVKSMSSCECRSRKLPVCCSERQDTQAPNAMTSVTIGHTRWFLLGRFRMLSDFGDRRGPSFEFVAMPQALWGSQFRMVPYAGWTPAKQKQACSRYEPCRHDDAKRPYVHSCPQNQGQRKYGSKHLHEAQSESNHGPALLVGKWHCHIHSRRRIYALANICQEKRGQRGQQPPERLSLVIFLGVLADFRDRVKTTFEAFKQMFVECSVALASL